MPSTPTKRDVGKYYFGVTMCFFKTLFRTFTTDKTVNGFYVIRRVCLYKRSVNINGKRPSNKEILLDNNYRFHTSRLKLYFSTEQCNNFITTQETLLEISNLITIRATFSGFLKWASNIFFFF